MCLCIAALGGCDRNAPQPEARTSPAATQDIATEADRVDAIELGVRLDQADNRIGDLENQVGELRDNPQSLRLELLQDRLEAVEARVSAHGDADPPNPTGGNAADRAPRQ